MKAVILAGGLGTRLSEETSVRPKPMVEIGGMPVLWHIMKIYSSHGINDFVVCCGYKGNVIKEWFANYYLSLSDVTFDLGKNTVEHHAGRAEPWRVTLVDTGVHSMTGGRLRRVRDHVGDETFCLTYGDGVSDVDISGSIDFHRAHGKEATMTAVQPRAASVRSCCTRAKTDVQSFSEKPAGDGAFINGGFFVLEPTVFDRIEGDSTVWEQEPLRGLARDGELQAFRHLGFWQPMDTLRDKQLLEELWEGGDAPWKRW
ncbi:MAG: glucose-1-phosphate cytidylyltransferase [Ilumatobacteraceae bacterium]